ncbi:uncharacterized protein F5891DRAFT_977942 [Suillus fuscotomentosus]|uniref:Uncharacterized protein n=1 Tax=Suillus fuscotomentosus TaxID=1912939 RepID=A0AAD4ECD1_9AGAM|nr:uncharacterized protein F5891DRAFT_977942 [Suillus fuscotomentosus]KAG1903376.1 hypothetical protein F5891DRAFT_977942 [Suillus fuscotomentosus]
MESASENNSGSPPLAQEALDSLRVPTSPQARAKRRIATLMEEVELLKQDKATKQRKTTYYVSQGRAIRRLVALYTPIEDLIAENDRRCEYHDEAISPESTMEHYQWIHDKLASLDHEESEDMLRKIRRGADSARGDDTGTLKELVASWLNVEFRPTPFISAGDKHRRGFGFKAIFTSPSSANEVDGDGEGADVIENNRRARRQSDQTKVKTCIASIIGMRKVTPCAIAYAACQHHLVAHHRLEISNYQMFWNNVVDFFEDPPGPAARGRVNDTLEWWTRKVFGTNHRQDLTSEVVSRMSVSALAAQRLAMEDAAFDSDS